MPIFNRVKAIAMPQKSGMDGVWEQIEAAARTCYKSEGKTKYDEYGNSTTAFNFASKIVNVYKHRSVAEHAAIYLLYHYVDGPQDEIVDRYLKNPFSRVHIKTEHLCSTAYITTNYRVILENCWDKDLQYMCDPTDYHDIRRTVRLFTDRGVSAESNRHRCQSPTERSTRFVNYATLSNNILICTPEEIKDEDIITSINEFGGKDNAFRNMCGCINKNMDNSFSVVDTWLFANFACEWSYMRLLELGWTPQQARRILPLDVETELVISAYEDQWARYFKMRYYGTTGTPHPDMKIACGCIMDAFVDQNWLTPINLSNP